MKNKILVLLFIWTSFLGLQAQTPAAQPPQGANTAYGINALNNGGNSGFNTAVGYKALEFKLANNDARWNQALGYRALQNLITGSGNVAIGSNSLISGDNISSNVALGNSAGTSLNNASGNVILGSSAMYESTFGNNNVCIGTNTGRNLYGNNNVLIGYWVGFNGGGSVLNWNDKLVIGNNRYSYLVYGDFQTKQIVLGGTSVLPTDTNYKLAVDGNIVSRELKIIAVGAPWPDYVFDDDYKIMPLHDLKNYIQINKSLPNIPTASEVSKDGILIGEMNASLLKKIEELTLYTIQQEEALQNQQKAYIELSKAYSNQQATLKSQEKKNQEIINRLIKLENMSPF